MKRASKKLKKTRRQGYVLKVTEKVIEWEPEATEKTPVDEIFERLLPRFGWTQDKSGHLEHIGLESGDEAR
ncbi:MAG TPA: hypothetical protein VJA94_15445 [Candidatus Angelobacter sp.]